MRTQRHSINTTPASHKIINLLTAASCAAPPKCVTAYPAAALGPNCVSPADPIDCAVAESAHAATERTCTNERMVLCCVCGLWFCDACEGGDFRDFRDVSIKRANKQINKQDAILNRLKVSLTVCRSWGGDRLVYLGIHNYHGNCIPLSSLA